MTITEQRGAPAHDDDLRTAVARIIEPGIFADDGSGSLVEFMGQARRTKALEQADAILALPGIAKQAAALEAARKALERARAELQQHDECYHHLTGDNVKEEILTDLSQSTR